MGPSERRAAILGVLAPLARRQYGLVTRAQLGDAGADKRWVARQVARGDLSLVETDVFFLGDGERTFTTEAMAACLQRGEHARICWVTAARLWGMAVPQAATGSESGQNPLDRIDVLVPYGSGANSSERVSVHRARRLDTADCALLDRLPITTPARTIADLAGLLEPVDLIRLVDDALVTERTTVPLLKHCLQRNGGGGVKGSAALRAVLAAWLGGSGATESHAEIEVLRWLTKKGFEAPVRQFAIMGREGLVARVDFAWPATGLVLEVDGFQHHHGPTKLSLDHERKSAIVALGYVVLTTTVAEVRRGGASLEAALAAHLGGR